MNSPADALQAVPNSSGTEPPRRKAPANSADCHIHIYDPRFTPPTAKMSNATAQDYRLLQKRLGPSARHDPSVFQLAESRS